MSPPLLSISGLHKRYAVPVLRGVDLEIAKGEVHALVGANGAGKTTLCNIICGISAADSGSMCFSGSEHAPVSVNDAEASGIRIVMQELNLIDNLSVAENLYFRSLPTTYGGLIDFGQLFEDATILLADMGMDDIDPRTPVHTLGIGQRQLIEISRQLIHPCKLLILDEPTAALTDPQIELLFAKIESLKASGAGIIYVSHRMEEIRHIADRVSVFKDGETVLSTAVADISTQEIVRRMADAPVDTPHDRCNNRQLATALKIRGLCTPDVLRDINLDIRFGEILGIAGLMGSGRTELLRSIFAADELSAGAIFSNDGSEPLSLNSPIDAVAHGIGLIPEDRKQQGLLLQQSLKSNVTLPSLSYFCHPAGWIATAKEDDAVESFRKSLDVKCEDIHQQVGQLSGGNQQKVVIARWLMCDSRILLFDEPTRGIDIHAKTAIYQLLGEFADAGKAVVIVSSESRELTDLCDRIAVMSNGKLAATFKRGEWTAEKIVEASFSAFVTGSEV
ncbi:MAG: sugar ABC transporter ATP-binding protein [Halioglobus sp.]